MCVHFRGRDHRTFSKFGHETPKALYNYILCCALLQVVWCGRMARMHETGIMTAEFEALASRMAPTHRALVLENVDPSTVTVSELMADLSTEFRSADAMQQFLYAATKVFKPIVLRCALSPEACATLRRSVDSNRRMDPDSVDQCPEHHLSFSREQLEMAIGPRDFQRLLRLPRDYLNLERKAMLATLCTQHAPVRLPEVDWIHLADDSPEPFMPHIRKHLQRQEEVQQQQQSTSSSANEMLPEEVETEDEYAVQTLEESFVRRYSADTRPFNPFHRDRYRVTINVALSAHEDYGGGHLLGVFDGHIHRMDRSEGDATVHNSDLVHAVSAVTTGTRYSLIMFFSVRPRPKR